MSIQGTTGSSARWGLGNDVYFVDATGDLIVEGAGGSSDTVYTSVSYALAGTAEIEVLSALTR